MNGSSIWDGGIWDVIKSSPTMHKYIHPSIALLKFTRVRSGWTNTIRRWWGDKDIICNTKGNRASHAKSHVVTKLHD